jgi:hypothetical protein
MRSGLRRLGFELVPVQRPPSAGQASPPSMVALPEGAEAYLHDGNARLRDLVSRYGGFDRDVTSPLNWVEGHVTPGDLRSFRADNAYVWQTRGRNMDEAGYALATYYLKSRDPLSLLDVLDDDGLFGAVTFEVAGKVVSRDLLDSIIELYFLRNRVFSGSLEDKVILDIGAGYGRLAHRALTAFPAIGRYICTDAYPISTFLCDYYLKFRGLDGKTSVVPLDEIESALERERVDVAVNVHSFPECQIAAIRWWLKLIAKNRVLYLMLVSDNGLKNWNNEDFSSVIAECGYRSVLQEPKYADPAAQRHAVNSSTHYVFELAP